MKIRRLEIQGFKSFVDRTVLTFTHDVTAIVGPNGCGKSNTVDAIRWCMGEQSPRHLRGKSMEDVIFAGSDSRPPHTFSEVTLTFDNRDGLGPVEYSAYSEISVTRRLTRDGTSEYLINRTPVRLLDVVSLFLGTGAGTKAYSVVEQGRIGLIVTSKSEDRRALLEEAAGITRYKLRKKAAEKKIELTKQNMLRVGDILAEIEKGLVTLKRAAQKAERFKSYRAEQRDLELYIFAHRLLELLAVNRVTTAMLDEREAQLAGVSAALARLDAESENDKRLLFDAEQTLERVQRESYAADNEVTKAEAELRRLDEQLVVARQRELDASRERAECESQGHTLVGERESLREQLEALERDELDAADRLGAADEQLRDMRERAQEAEARLTQHRAAQMAAERTLASAEASRNALARRLAESEQRRQRLDGEKRSLEKKVGELGDALAGVEERVQALRDRRDDLMARREGLDDELVVQREAREGAERRISEARRERDRAEARLRALREVAARHEGVGKGVQAVLASKRAGVMGLLAEQLEVPQGLAPAVAAVLADRWQDVRVSDAETALGLVEWLRKENRGRASLVSETDVATVARAAVLEHPPHPGVRGMLFALCGGARSVPDALAPVLQRAVLVETLGDALRSRRALGADADGYVYVSLEGDLLDGAGRVVGGTPEKAGAGLLSTQAELRELEPKVEALERICEDAQQELDDARARANELQRMLELTRTDLHVQDMAVLTAERDAKAHEAERLAAENRLGQLLRELGEVEQGLAHARGEDEGFDRAFTDAQLALERAREGMMTDEAEAQAWRGEVERATARLTDAKVVSARARERATAVRGTIDRLEKSIAELAGRQARLAEELARLAQSQSAAQSQSGALRDALGGRVEQARALRDALRDARVRYDELRNAVGDAEARAREARVRREAVARQVAALELKSREEILATEHLLQTAAEKHQVVLPRILGEYHLRPPPSERERARVDELRTLIERMGEVNLTAIDEYAAQEKRAKFFATQKGDLEQALAQLEEAIAQMNRESKRRFRETFDAVNEHFRVLFPRLFRGGQGELRLSNPDDLLETGVEIVAQPPGKKLVNLEAMSGGEKTLTAVTLLFALFMYRPSPFCLLDEVEAALDEANVIRLNDLVRELTARSQFIMITHNKRTMAMADVLYGVTMEEPGVSKLVGVKLKRDAAAPSETGAVA